ncbi:MAG TPA: OmpA family protein [Myxococcales bacterium]|nr:OmpA family protein [Myxococcales bacterium]
MRAPRILALAAVTAAACAHAPPPPPPEAPPPTQQAAPAPAAPPPAAPEPAPAPAPQPLPQQVSIYFEFDSSTLSADSRSRLQSFYGEVRDRSDVRVRIEGNCDERGTSEYNLALGQRRADAAKKYLQDLGLDSSRITAISNGEEKPRDPGHKESAWRENRRDDLIPGTGASASSAR